MADLVEQQLEAGLGKDVLPALVEGGVGVGRLAGDESLDIRVEQVGMDEEAAFAGVRLEPGGVGDGRGAGHGGLEELNEGRIHDKKRDRGK